MYLHTYGNGFVVGMTCGTITGFIFCLLILIALAKGTGAPDDKDGFGH